MDFPDNEVKVWQLAEKWINGTITPSEEVEFSAWYNANQGNMVMLPGKIFLISQNFIRKAVAMVLAKK